MKNEAYATVDGNGISPDVTYAADSDDIDVEVRRHMPNNGPWANTSTDAYSRTVHHPEPSPVIPRRYALMMYALCAAIFVTGIFIGIMIGRYGIQRGDTDSGTVANLSATTTTATTTTTTTTTTATTSSDRHTECTCPTTVTPSNDACIVCQYHYPDVSTGNEYKTSLFATLTREEISTVISLMKSQDLVSSISSFGANYITHILLHPTNKSLALSYLDNNETFPGRYAKVIVVRGLSSPPSVMEYKVGPLNENTDNIVIEELFGAPGIDFNRRPYDAKERGKLSSYILPHINAIKDLLVESFDGAYFSHGLAFSTQTLPTLDNADRTSSFYLYLLMTGGSTLRILPISGIVHHPGINTDNWYMSDMYYINQGPFANGEELMSAYNNGSLRKFRLPSGYRAKHSTEYSLYFNTSLPQRENSDVPPPRTYEPEGARYSIKGNVVTWMGWSFEWTADAVRGPAVYNILFKGERVAYEISLQDVTLVYASGTTGAGISPAVLSDTEYYLGNFNTPRLGVDCPERSAYIQTTLFRKNPVTRQSACVFEADGQRPLWRHGSSGLVDHHLVVRAPMNLGNYDYSLEFRFYLGGDIKTSLASSGYLYASFWDPDDPLVDAEKSNSAFGFRISDFLSGPIHDHSFMFKVDLDVVGTSNSFERIHWRGGDIVDALKTQTNVQDKPGFFPFNNTRYIEYELQEREAGFVVDTKHPEVWTIVNENEKNVWGVRRGYRILPVTYAAETLPEFIMFGAWPHLKHHCVITRRKDEEFYGTDSLYDLNHPGVGAFGGIGKMMDNETIRNEDLVAWVTVKFNHVPTAEDLPMTQSVHRGFELKPFNYFDRTPTFDVQGHYQKNRPYNPLPCYDPQL